MGKYVVLIAVLVAGFVFAMPAYAQTATPTPTQTPTPLPTATPIPTPVAADYYVTLPSGGVGVVSMEVSAGDAMITAALMVVAAVLVFGALQRLVQGARAK